MSNRSLKAQFHFLVMEQLIQHTRSHSVVFGRIRSSSTSIMSHWAHHIMQSFFVLTFSFWHELRLRWHPKKANTACFIVSKTEVKSRYTFLTENKLSKHKKAVTNTGKRINNCVSGWWTIRDSNSRPLRCERSALPTELIARKRLFNRHFAILT